MATSTFIVDCPFCKAKVAAVEMGRAEHSGFDHEVGEPFGLALLVGSCPSCNALIAGETRQIAFDGFDADYDQWSLYIGNSVEF